jgi:hypothetical protein
LLDDADRHDFLKTLAEAIRRGEMKRRGWKEPEPRRRPKSDGAKMEMAARRSRESTSTLANIAERLQMGSQRSLGSMLCHLEEAP